MRVVERFLGLPYYGCHFSSIEVHFWYTLDDGSFLWRVPKMGLVPLIACECTVPAVWRNPKSANGNLAKFVKKQRRASKSRARDWRAMLIRSRRPLQEMPAVGGYYYCVVLRGWRLWRLSMYGKPFSHKITDIADFFCENATWTTCNVGIA